MSMPQINKEKFDILETPGDMLVTANPGTGKTKLLSFKYLSLIRQGIEPEDILCLTFTNKARSEMEERIVELVRSEGFKIERKRMNIHTFHSYALEQIDEDNLISATFLRYIILRFLRDRKYFNYGDFYIFNTIVPNIEKHIHFLKTLGILPNDINIEKVKELITSEGNYTKEELDKYAASFLEMYKMYEDSKRNYGIDYGDMLIKYNNLKRKPVFKHVLVDELQDVNKLEAKMATEAGETFFAVGDPKQAIFAFQGGSITNFDLFKTGTIKILSENFRSSNEVLDYARQYYSAYTAEDDHVNQLQSLKNFTIQGQFPLPKIYGTEKKGAIGSACSLVEELSLSGEKLAVISRTNLQLSRVSTELEKRGIEHSTTFFSASDKVKAYIIEFLQGLFTHDPNLVLNSLFTPFAPVSLEKASMISETNDLTLELIFEQAPEIKQLYDSVENVEDINQIFIDIIFPISINYGKDFYESAMAIYNSYEEGLKNIKIKRYSHLIDYLNSTMLDTSEISVDKNICISTIHKAKGKEFDHVIYLPQDTVEKNTFQEIVFKHILRSLNINLDKEFDEEPLRLDFVAITRAKKSLHIVTYNPENYHTGYFEESCTGEFESSALLLEENAKRAFNLFINRHYEEAKDLLVNNKKWLMPFIENHFKNLKHLSFSAIRDSAYDYFKERILKTKTFSTALSIGSMVHDVAENIMIGEQVQYDSAIEPYINNVQSVINEITDRYTEKYDAEYKLNLKMKDIFNINDDIHFTGYIDAIFKSGDDYLLIDWKTNRNKDSSHNKYRVQLEIYRRAFALDLEIPISSIKTAIAYIGLRPGINTGAINYTLEYENNPTRVFNNFQRKVQTIIEWKNNVKTFCHSFLKDKKEDDYLWRAIAEQLYSELDGF